MKTLRLGNQAQLISDSAALFQTSEPGSHVCRTQGPYEILFTREGSLGIEEDGVEFVVERGQAVLIFPGARIRGTRAFQPEMILNFVHFEIDGPTDAGDEVIEVRQYTAIRRPERLATLFHLLIEEQDARGWDGPTQRLLIRLILHEVADSPLPPDVAEAGRSAAHELADRAANWIAENINEGISTRDVAAALSHHPNYLSRVFREHHGHTIVDHIHAGQVDIARQHLVASTDSVRSIALECGFNDEGYFRRVFRRHTGMTPRAFRSAYSPMPAARANRSQQS